MTPRVRLLASLKGGTVGRVRTFDSWPAAGKHMTEAGSFPSKEVCSLFSAGILDGPLKGRIPRESTLVVGEHAPRDVGVDKAISRLKKAGIPVVIHTSASQAPEKPRRRVVARLQPCSAENYYRCIALLNGAHGGCLARESGDLSRRWYYGQIEGADSPDAALEALRSNAVGASRPMHRLMRGERT